jgi:hypothetical protein
MYFDDTLKTFVKKDLEAGLSPMLLGEPGIGKSSFMEAIGADFGTKVFTIPCNQLSDRADLTGGRLLKDEKTGTYAQHFFPHATIMDCIQYALDHKRENPILFLDEVNRASSDITSAILSFTTARRIGTIEFPDNVRFCLAGNDKGNVTSLDEASISRFSIYHVEPDLATFLGLDPNLNHYVKDTLRQQPTALFGKNLAVALDNKDDDDDGDAAGDIYEFLDDEAFNQIAAPRTITNLGKWLDMFSDAELMALIQADRLHDALVAHTGETLFTNTLVAVITAGVTTSSNSPKKAAVVKPKCYDELVTKSTTTRDELNDAIAACDKRELSAALVYALHEKTDREAIITAISTKLDTLEADSLKTLMSLTTSNEVDAENVQTFLDTNTPLALQLTAILSLVQ